MTRLVRLLPWASLLATIALTASAEAAAGEALGLGPMAWVLPVAIDCYVIGAVAARRDLLPALLVLAGAVAAGHWLTAPDAMRIPSALLGPVLALVLWRVEVLAAPAPQAAPETVAEVAPTGPDPAPRPALTPETAVARRREAEIADAALAERREARRIAALAAEEEAASVAASEPPADDVEEAQRAARVLAEVGQPVTKRSLAAELGWGSTRTQRVLAAAKAAAGAVG